MSRLNKTAFLNMKKNELIIRISKTIDSSRGFCLKFSLSEGDRQYSTWLGLKSLNLLTKENKEISLSRGIENHTKKILGYVVHEDVTYKFLFSDKIIGTSETKQLSAKCVFRGSELVLPITEEEAVFIFSILITFLGK